MRIILHNRVLKEMEILPLDIRRKIDVILNILAYNHRDSRLHLKKLSGEINRYSFRAGRDYRGIFCILDPATICVVKIAHRKDVYRK
jgi:mRNA-degrading endonuclease RelE of RelBE toxin-antitoxin system